MSTLALAVLPHLIPAATIAAGDLERAMSEPLAADRDEVLYLVCSHPRIRLGSQVGVDGGRAVYQADGDIGGLTWGTDDPWARVFFPVGVEPSALGWAVLDPMLESHEGLSGGARFDTGRDPEGERGRHRIELLSWIFDRHARYGEEGGVNRGSVHGGEIAFRLEYVGKSQGEALRRPFGAHHKMPVILGAILTYEPSRLVYFLPCDVFAGRWSDPAEDTSMLPLKQASVSTRLPRELLIAAAEESLIATMGTRHNARNTRRRSFPMSHAGEQLVAEGVTEVLVGFYSLPEHVSIVGRHSTVFRESRVTQFTLPA